MSITEFEQLPVLLKRKQAMALLAVSEKTYYAMVSAANGDAVTLPGTKEKRLRKNFLRFLIEPEERQKTVHHIKEQPR